MTKMILTILLNQQSQYLYIIKPMPQYWKSFGNIKERITWSKEVEREEVCDGREGEK